MPDKVPQNLANHARLDPWFHFFLLPVFGLTVIVALVHLIFHPRLHPAGLLLLSIAGLVAVFKIRLYALKVQDRVIRLEERQRLASLLPEPMRVRIPEFTERQLIALRFASDAELPGLAERTLAQNLAPAEIKKSIQSWRPDYWRV
jgi:hypothetical protein